MFKKSKRSFRQRTKHSEEDSDDEKSQQQQQQQSIQVDNNEEFNNETTRILNHKFGGGSFDPDSNSNDDGSNLSFKSSSNNKSERKTKLSFEDDEEEDVFIVKKSLYSRRMEKNKKKLLKTKIMKNSQENQQHLDNKNTENNNDNNETNVRINQQSETTITNSDLKEKEDIIVCPASDPEEEDDIVDEDYSYKNSNNSKKGPQFRSALERGFIPDAKTIYELKKQRQKMARTVNEDFIPLDDESNNESSKTNNTNRLVRESDDDKSEDGDLPTLDDDDDDDETRNRIQFGNVDYQTKENEKFKERFRAAQEKNQESFKNNKKDYKDNDIMILSDDEDNYNDDDDDDDKDNSTKNPDDESEDEIEKWEREQIRKAVRLPNIYSYSQTEINNKYLNSSVAVGDKTATLINKLKVLHDNHNVVPIEIDDHEQDTKKSFGSYIPPYIMNDRSQNNSESILNTFGDKIIQARQQLESSIEENQQLYDRVCMDIKLTINDLETYDPDVLKLTDDYNFYRNMFDFVNNLCDCINDKLPMLEKLEKQALDLFKNISQKSIKQNRLEIQEQNSISLYFIMNHKALSIGYANNDSISTILDLFDFNGDQQRKIRAINLETRNRRKFSPPSKNFEIDEGLNDNPLIISNDIRKEFKEIQSKLKELFDDTDDDFASIKGILEQFKRWKNDDKRLETYRESFINEFLPKFLLYYLRYELVLWNIFFFNIDDNQDDELYLTKLNLTEMESIQNLILYVTSSSSSSDPSTINFDPIDLNVIPELIDRVIIPKITTMIELELWNPLSTGQTSRLVTFLNLLSKNFPTIVDSTSENLPNLLQKIMLRIEKCIENDIFIPQMIPGDFFQSSSSTNLNNQQRSKYESMVYQYVREFFEYQYWQTFRLMKNIISLRNLINDNFIKELSLDRICFRYILMSIQRSALDAEITLIRLKNLIYNIPKEWFNNKLNNVNIFQQFNLFFQQLIDNYSIINFYNETERKKLLELKQSILNYK